MALQHREADFQNRLRLIAFIKILHRLDLIHEADVKDFLHFLIKAKLDALEEKIDYIIRKNHEQ